MNLNIQGKKLTSNQKAVTINTNKTDTSITEDNLVSSRCEDYMNNSFNTTGIKQTIIQKNSKG